MLQINRINEEKRAIMDQLEDAERQLKKRDDEVARLRRENDMLRDEVCPFPAIPMCLSPLQYIAMHSQHVRARCECTSA